MRYVDLASLTKFRSKGVRHREGEREREREQGRERGRERESKRGRERGGGEREGESVYTCGYGERAREKKGREREIYMRRLQRGGCCRRGQGSLGRGRGKKKRVYSGTLQKERTGCY